MTVASCMHTFSGIRIYAGYMQVNMFAVAKRHLNEFCCYNLNEFDCMRSDYVFL